MREISSGTIQEAVYRAISRMSYHCDPRVTLALSEALNTETNELARDALQSILQNHKLSPETSIPLCQDTGSTVVFAEIGAHFHLTGQSLPELINAAVRRAQKDCPLRASTVADPLFERNNRGDNTPAIIHIEYVEGDKIRLLIAQKGGGAENMSFMKMLSPALGAEGIIDFVCEGVLAAGSRPCPPLILGIGIGSNFEGAPLLAKKALFEPFGRAHPDLRYRQMESEITKRINTLGCGVQGFGGSCTVLATHILQAPCHIASLPVAVNLQCHAHRHSEVII
ncbi:MAG: fumarate hydratase [Candidatus Cloacimonetes bacterium]|nr:fumarate hydratase [Candidatus Cloacimonadota bacterium]MCB5287850.1 fumarate hydratase [Candidatus Cloacimonadota bacterium]MCK9184943.1 fumarate hydratase [Candidatus Cloacimonadota bacterium]MDY0230170.1 fumarate hydratase [Candidatus Cloacimonadaceae bacterium]